MKIMRLEIPISELHGINNDSIAKSIMISVFDKPVDAVQDRYNKEREEKLWKQRGATPLKNFMNFSLQELSEMF